MVKPGGSSAAIRVTGSGTEQQDEGGETPGRLPLQTDVEEGSSDLRLYYEVVLAAFGPERFSSDPAGRYPRSPRPMARYVTCTGSWPPSSARWSRRRSSTALPAGYTSYQDRPRRGGTRGEHTRHPLNRSGIDVSGHAPLTLRPPVQDACHNRLTCGPA